MKHIKPQDNDFGQAHRDFTPAWPEISTALLIGLFPGKEQLVLRGHISSCLGPYQPKSLVSADSLTCSVFPVYAGVACG